MDKFSIDFIRDRTKLKDILNNHFKGNTSKVNTMLLGYDEGIVDEIQNQQTVERQWILQQSKRLAELYGLKEEVADVSIITWVTLFRRKELTEMLEKERIGVFYLFKCGRIEKCSSEMNRYLQLISWILREESFPFEWLTNCDENSLRSIIGDCLKSLKPIEQLVVNKYFGLGDNDLEMERYIEEDLKTIPESYEEVLKFIQEEGINQSVFEYLLNKACRKLRHPSRLGKVRRYFKPRSNSYSGTYGVETQLKTAITNDLRKVFLNDDSGKNYPVEKLIKGLEIINETLQYPPIQEAWPDIPLRIYRCLERAGIRTTDALLRLSPDDLMKIRNLGTKCAEIVTEFQRTYSAEEVQCDSVQIDQDRILGFHLCVRGNEIEKTYIDPITAKQASEELYDLLIENGAFFTDEHPGNGIDGDLRDFFMRMGYFYTEDLYSESQFVLAITKTVFPQYTDRIVSFFASNIAVVDMKGKNSNWLNTHLDIPLSLGILRDVRGNDYYKYLKEHLLLHDSTNSADRITMLLNNLAL